MTVLRAVSLRPARCKACRGQYQRLRPLQRACSPECAMKLAAVVRTKAEIAARKVTRAQLDAIKPRGKWMAEAQTAFNAWIRARDSHLPCVSCGRMHEGQWHAGHFLTTGARPELRFDEQNCHRQCAPCNSHLHGNLVLYRPELIRRIGLAAVEHLEGHHEPKKWSISELKVIRDEYRTKLRAMR